MAETFNLNFPILIRPEEGEWLAICLLTCTTSLAPTPSEAFSEVAGLLQRTVQDALEDAGTVEEAFRMLVCPADATEQARYMAARSSESGPTAQLQHGKVSIEIKFRARRMVGVC